MALSMGLLPPWPPITVGSRWQSKTSSRRLVVELLSVSPVDDFIHARTVYRRAGQPKYRDFTSAQLLRNYTKVEPGIPESAYSVRRTPR